MNSTPSNRAEERGMMLWRHREVQQTKTTGGPRAQVIRCCDCDCVVHELQRRLWEVEILSSPRPMRIPSPLGVSRRRRGRGEMTPAGAHDGRDHNNATAPRTQITVTLLRPVLSKMIKCCLLDPTQPAPKTTDQLNRTKVWPRRTGALSTLGCCQDTIR